MKRIIAFLCFVVLVFTFVACGKSGKANDKLKDEVGKQVSGKIEKLLLSPYGDRVFLKTYEIKTDYVSVTYNGNLSPSDIKFRSEDEDVAKVRYISTPLDGCVCYSIEGVHYGTTYIHIESADGNICAKTIKVVVDKETVTTTVPLSLRSYHYSTPDGYYFDLKPSTKSSKTDEDETTSKSRHDGDSSTSPHTQAPTGTVPSEAPTTPPTDPPAPPEPPTDPPVTGTRPLITLFPRD